jgi:hypothetical protein
MTEVISLKDCDVIGWEPEVTWGVDVATTRLAPRIDIKKFDLTVDKNVEARVDIGDGVDPAGFWSAGTFVDFDLEGKLLDDIPANSLIAMALGSAPDAGTGAVTNYPNASFKNLRTATWEAGYTHGALSDYWRLRGCILKRLELRAHDFRLDIKMKWVGKDYTRQGTRFVAAPARPTALPFDGYKDATLTLASPTLDSTEQTDLAIIIENVIDGEKSGYVGGGAGVGHLQIVGRTVTVEVNRHQINDEFQDLFDAAMDAAARDVTMTAQWSKAAAAEFVKFTLSDCQPISPQRHSLTSESASKKEAWIFRAKTYSFDDKTP